MSIVAPLVALEARGATTEQVCESAEGLAKIPKETLRKIKDKGKKHCDASCTDFDENTYGTIACVLWMNFVAGVQESGATIPAESKLDQFIVDAYETENCRKDRCGDLVAARSNQWGDKYGGVTNTCARFAGIIAGRRVGKGEEIAIEDFRDAYEKVSKMMNPCPDSDEPLRTFGGAC